MPSQGINKVLLAAAVKLLKPLVRILLRNGVAYGAFVEIVKWVYVEVAGSEFRIPNRKNSLSRISVVTGIPRKEVARVAGVPHPEDHATTQRYNRAARVVSGWVRDTDFAGEGGKPAELPLEGEKSFSELVRRHGGDVPVKAVLDELSRVDCATVLKDGRVKLLVNEYVPGSEKDDLLNILGVDVADLIKTIDHNMTRSVSEESRVQLQVCYDNMPESVMPRLRMLSREKARQIMKELDQWMASHDRDSNPSLAGDGRVRAGLGVYYFEEPCPEKENART